MHIRYLCLHDFYQVIEGDVADVECSSYAAGVQKGARNFGLSSPAPLGIVDVLEKAVY